MGVRKAPVKLFPKSEKSKNGENWKKILLIASVVIVAFIAMFLANEEKKCEKLRYWKVSFNNIP